MGSTNSNLDMKDKVKIWKRISLAKLRNAKWKQLAYNKIIYEYPISANFNMRIHADLLITHNACKLDMEKTEIIPQRNRYMMLYYLQGVSIAENNERIEQCMIGLTKEQYEMLIFGEEKT